MRRLPELPLPARRFVPGQGPHPRTLSESLLPVLPASPRPGPRSVRWLYGLDLFDHAYWWEAHEVWEGLWLTLERDSPEAQLVQGMIQLAASRLTAELGRTAASERLQLRATARLRAASQGISSTAWGVDLDALCRPSTLDQD